jgi:nucleotide-binding universal stress UspA family protein
MAPWIPDYLTNQLGNRLQVPSYDDLLEEMEALVYQYFDKDDPVTCEVLEGSVQLNLWQESFVKEMDLFIAGRKEKHLGRGLFPKKFVRKSVCSVLLVPPATKPEISKIWVPVDFSDTSGEALSQALHLAQEMNPVPEVVLHHIYELPHAYFYQGFPIEEAMNAMKLDAEQKCEEFLARFNNLNLPVTEVFTPLSLSYAAEHIKIEAEKADASLILLAAGGRSRFSKILLGSETEQIISKEHEIPVLVLKKRKERIGLMDVLNI